MAAAAMALQAVGGIVEAGGHIYEGNAAGAAADYNAAASRQKAAQAEQQAAEEERRARIQSRKQIGESRAAVGASGVQLEGSPLDAIEESAMNAELDALTIRHQGQVKKQGFLADAQLSEFEGKTARTAGYIRAASSVLKTGSSMAGKR